MGEVLDSFRDTPDPRAQEILQAQLASAERVLAEIDATNTVSSAPATTTRDGA